MNKKGFTLIELLVVIAIIGILSSVAVVYLGDARNKANDAKVQSNVTTASTQIEIDRANGTTPDAASVAAVIAKLGDHPCSGTFTSNYDTALDNVAIYALQCSSGKTTNYFCADSQGFRGDIGATAPTANSGLCQ